MALKKCYPANVAPYFGGSYYDFLIKKIYIFLQYIDFNLWYIVEKWFVSKSKSIWSEDDKNNFILNIKTVKILHQALHENVYEKISKCSNAKDILNILDSIYLTNQSCEFVDNVHRENKKMLQRKAPMSQKKKTQRQSHAL